MLASLASRSKTWKKKKRRLTVQSSKLKAETKQSTIFCVNIGLICLVPEARSVIDAASPYVIFSNFTLVLACQDMERPYLFQPHG